MAALGSSVPTPAKARGTLRSSPSPLEECVRSGGIEEAWNMVEEMQRQGVPMTRFTISRLLQKSAGGDGRSSANPTSVCRGIDLTEKFVRTCPQEADEVLFNAILDACYRAKDRSRMEAALRLMEEMKVQPSHVTLGILVKAYGQAGDATRVLNLWDRMSEQREQANAVTHGCMIDACVKCGRLNKAMEIFQDMKREKKHRNTILYTTLIKGHGIEKDLRTALALFREMKQERVPYSRITYNSIIDVCIRCSDVQAAENLLAEMTASGSGIEPDIVTYSTLLKGYCQLGDLDRALQVAESMKAYGLQCDELVYNTLMDGCVRANDLSAGIGLLAEMVRCGMRPSPITHSILVRLYQRSGCTEDAFDAVAKLYSHHGLPPPVVPPERRGKRSGAGRRGGNRQRGKAGPGASALATIFDGATAPAPAPPQPTEAPPQPIEAGMRQAPELLPQLLQLQQLQHQQLQQQQLQQQQQQQQLLQQQLLQQQLLQQQQQFQALQALQTQAQLTAPPESLLQQQVYSLPSQQPPMLPGQDQMSCQEAQAMAVATKHLSLLQALSMDTNSVPNVVHQAAIGPAPLGEQRFPNLLQQMTRGPVPICPPQLDAGVAGQLYGNDMYSFAGS